MMCSGRKNYPVYQSARERAGEGRCNRDYFSEDVQTGKFSMDFRVCSLVGNPLYEKNRPRFLPTVRENRTSHRSRFSSSVFGRSTARTSCRCPCTSSRPSRGIAATSRVEASTSVAGMPSTFVVTFDHLVSRIDLDGDDPERVVVGHVDSRALAADFMISRTHLQRLFAKAAQQGCIGWDTIDKKPVLWMSRSFVEQYSRWQAIKFAYVDDAFRCEA